MNLAGEPLKREAWGVREKMARLLFCDRAVFLQGHDVVD